MAEAVYEIDFSEADGMTMYFIVRLGLTVWNGVVFVPENPANWATYAIPLTRTTVVPGLWARYRGQFPREITDANTYRVEAYRQLAVPGSPAATDGPPLYESNLIWTGVTVSTILPAGRWMDLKKMVSSNLGGNDIDVELHDDDYAESLGYAVRELNRWRPQHGLAALTTYSPSVKKYVITAPSLIGILDVQGVDDSALQCNPCDPFWPYPYGSAFAYRSEGYGEQMQMVHNRQTGELVDGYDLDWDTGNSAPGVVELFVNGGRSGTKVSYRYTWGITPDDDVLTGVGKIPQGDINWVADLAQARGRQILGRKLRKYGGINMPDGVEQLDGAELVTEGREDERRLIEDIKRRRRPVLPKRG
jgi:hypothetical protein